MLAIFMTDEAKKRGISPDALDFDFAVWVIERLTEIETDRADLAALQKALNKAAVGETALAGRLLRDLMVNNACNAATANLLVREIQNKLRGPIAGGAKTASRRKKQLAPRNAEICCKAGELAKSGMADREIPSILAKRYDLSRDHIRKIINNQ